MIEFNGKQFIPEFPLYGDEWKTYNTLVFMVLEKMRKKLNAVFRSKSVMRIFIITVIIFEFFFLKFWNP